MSHLRTQVARSLLLASLIAAGSPRSAPGQSGHTSWGPWTFDWEVRDQAGIAIRDVRYNGVLNIYKASLPVIRVKYVKDFAWWPPSAWFGCGPYADRISWSNLVPTTCSSSKICQRSFTQGGTSWLELGGYARIGAYH